MGPLPQICMQERGSHADSPINPNLNNPIIIYRYYTPSRCFCQVYLPHKKEAAEATPFIVK